MSNTSYRNQILDIAKAQYHTTPERPWPKSPENEVLRHSSNNKWYGLLMSVPRNKLGLEGDECVDVLNLKIEPAVSGSFMLQDGILPGYHMNKMHWISVLLDGTVPMNTIELLLDMSYQITMSKKKNPPSPSSSK